MQQMNTKNSRIDNPGPAREKRHWTDRREFSWCAFLLGPPFRLIGFFYRTYQANRKRLTTLGSKQWASSGSRIVMLLTLFLWIAVWLLASEQSRSRLTDAVQQYFGGISTALDD